LSSLNAILVKFTSRWLVGPNRSHRYTLERQYYLITWSNYSKTIAEHNYHLKPSQKLNACHFQRRYDFTNETLKRQMNWLRITHAFRDSKSVQTIKHRLRYLAAWLEISLIRLNFRHCDWQKDQTIATKNRNWKLCTCRKFSVQMSRKDYEMKRFSCVEFILMW
jgi:hypothetical protein